MAKEQKVLTEAEQAYLDKFGISKEDVDKLKRKHPDLMMSYVKNLDPQTKKERAELYFLYKKPDMATFSLAATRMFDKDMPGAQRAFYANCVVWADPLLAEGSCSGQHQFGAGRIIGEKFPIPDGGDVTDF